MNILKTTILTGLLLAILSVPALAQSKVATVDMRKLFSGYWKTKQAENLLDKEKADLRKDLKGMADDLDKAQNDYKQLLEQANDQAIAQDERDRRKQAAADKAKEITNSKVAMDQFQRQAESRLSDKSQRMTGNIVSEIQKVVSDQAKARGYTLVVNSAASEIVLYANTSDDLTDTVLKQLAVGAPVDLTAPAAMPPLVYTNSP